MTVATAQPGRSAEVDHHVPWEVWCACLTGDYRQNEAMDAHCAGSESVTPTK
ncbi:hypothetical protein [Mycobacterium sp. AZCC_0083]|uniref:hypothetical protein n=1 Tax=Mycobacterium sp. AZCC_0083 TaxID=2735882 RepID=UPI00160B050C|nr:hypothetical protein [Mycobacterium sp. AZCC_0083]MBB5166884.1 hypothetical protein [Mycobacterium sp. AZCC_0083]